MRRRTAGSSNTAAWSSSKFFLRELEADQPDAVAQLHRRIGLSDQDYREYLAGEGCAAYERCQEEAAADHVFGVPFFIFAASRSGATTALGPCWSSASTEAGLALDAQSELPARGLAVGCDERANRRC